MMAGLALYIAARRMRPIVGHLAPDLVPRYPGYRRQCRLCGRDCNGQGRVPVSYTHLTLPTNREV